MLAFLMLNVVMNLRMNRFTVSLQN